MTNEKNLSVEQTAAPTSGITNTENSNIPDKETSDRELFTSFKLSRELRCLVVDSELRIMKTFNDYSKGMNKEFTKEKFEYYLDQTPYARLSQDGMANSDACCSLILRAAVTCLFVCVKVKGDEMHSNLFGKDICECEHTFEEANAVDDFQVVISNSRTGFTEVHRNFLEKLYPNAHDKAEMVKLAFSNVIMFAARLNGNFFAHLTSAGSKKTAMRFFHLEMLRFVDEQKKVLVDVFSRTASIAFASMGIFDEIHCGDKDKRFVNFFNVLRDYPVALVLRIRSIALEFKNTVLDTGYSEEEQKQRGKKFYEDICTRRDSELHKAKKSITIDTAACLMYWLRFSHKGFGEEFNLEQAKGFIGRLDTVCTDLLYTSMVLADKVNSRNIQKGIYKKTVKGLAYKSADEADNNTISISPVSYERWDFMKAILKYINNPNALIALDSPYLRQFLFSCGDYKNSFAEKHMREMFELFKGARCKVILFHSENTDIETMANSYGFRLVGTYEKGNTTEVTQVYSLNISSDEKFFDPKNHGDLY